LATDLQTYKEINSCCKSEIYRSEYLVVTGDKNAKGKFEVPDSSFLDVALFQLVKGDFLQGIISDIFRIEQWKNNGFSFSKTALSYPNYLFPNPNMIVQILPFNMTISTFICRNTYHLRMFWNQ
jgi:hypothetical protein